MAATIKIKNSSTANAKPTSSDLVQGELALNVTDKKIFTEDSGGNIVELGANFNGFKNRIINGAMVIDQRYAGSSGAISGAAYVVDRWRIIRVGGTSTLTCGQSTTAPSGFTNSFLVTAGSGATPATTEERSLSQPIEGFNVADLGWGAAGAQSVTISFWVQSSVTGTYGLLLGNSAGTRGYVASYAINSANTWEYKTVTVAGDTSGTWLKTNGAGLVVYWDLGTGPTYSGSVTGAWQSSYFEGLTGGTKLSATSGATWYITGVQLEKGSTATSFDYRPYGTELALCQRYLPSWSNVGNAGNTGLGVGQCYSGTQSVVVLPNPVQSRVPATGITVTGSGTNIVYSSTASPLNVSSIAFNTATLSSVQVVPTVSSGLTAGNATNLLLGAGNLIYATGCEL